MTGANNDWADEYRPGCFTGLLPRAVGHLWAEMEARCGTPGAALRVAAAPRPALDEVDRKALTSGRRRRAAGFKYTVRASFLEIYNEMVYDLWNPKAGSLSVREYPPGYWRCAADPSLDMGREGRGGAVEG